MHPAYMGPDGRGLSLAMRLFLGLGRPWVRMMVLKHAENEDDEERALVGNSILLANPNPETLLSKLPPSADDLCGYFTVIYSSDTHTDGSAAQKANIRKKKALHVDRARYVKCVSLRRKVCPVYAEVEIDEDRACEVGRPI